MRAIIDRSPRIDRKGSRIVIEEVYPAVDGSRYPVKRTTGETVEVWADILSHGHSVLAAELLWRVEGARGWLRAPMRLDQNDRWTASFTPTAPGQYAYSIEAWTDRYGTWRRDYLTKLKAGLDVSMEEREGRLLLDRRAPSEYVPTLAELRRKFDAAHDTAILLSDAAVDAAAKIERSDLTRSRLFRVIVDRPIARAGAWYEMVPRSQGRVHRRHGTFEDCIDRLPDIAAMGFDVLYLTPIHPIGETNRKGRNNALEAEPGAPGSFYAIGSQAGGHDAVHPELGTLEDFRRLVAACKEHGLEIALDFAVQCSPDHPWLRDHPQWFRRRPDGSIQYAENPPKKYEDIVNPDLACEDYEQLWAALRDVLLFWVGQGVRIFRVDNPHTKPFDFWEWLISQIQSVDPGVIFLSEAFTRPKIMKALAKLGFNQSYTYFTWRTSKEELQAYLSEITRYPEREYFRPNFFVSTPDILPLHLQSGEPSMFKARLVLAATLSGSYGIYNGFELLEHQALPGKEEYLNSEKYELIARDWDREGNIKVYIARLNRLRKENPALLQTGNLRFAQVDDPEVIGFVKESVDHENAVAVAVALTTAGPRQFWFHFGGIDIGLPGNRRPVSTIENVVTGERHRLEWGGVSLGIDPAHDPALLFRCS